MIFRLVIITLFCFFLRSVPAFSQEKSLNPEEIKLETRAFTLFKEEKFAEALPLMSQLLSMYPKEADYNYGYAVCLIETNQETEKAIKYLQYADSKSTNPLIKYYLGRAYHLNYKFEEALGYYSAYASKALPADKKKYAIDNMIAMCNNGKELIRYISDLTVVDNKKMKNENYFYSYELKDFGGKLIIKPPEFKSKIDKKLEPSNTVIFLPSNAKTVLYGSYGEKNVNGRDIYIIKKDSLGVWGKPVNIGVAINTSFDEDFPFLQADGKTLFFSSKGHNSMGGYDIFKSVFDSTKKVWSKPINLDFPINTPYDDYLFVPDKDELYAFFASNRETTGDKISVYKIIVDKQPVERQFNNLEEIINTSKLEISPLADIKRVEDSRTDVKKNQVLAQNNAISNKNNVSKTNATYVPLTYTPNLTNEQISTDVAKDEEKIKSQSSDIRKQSDMAYIAAEEKNKLANEKRKLASDKTEEINKITDPSLQEKKKQEVYDLITDAENIEHEAVTAFTMAKNLDQIASEMEKDANKTKNLFEAINTASTGNNNTESLVEAVNKNKERLNDSQNKYSSLDNEIMNKTNLSIEKQNEFNQIEKEYQANLNDVLRIEDEVSTLKQQLDNENDNSKKTELLTVLKDKEKQLDESHNKDSVLEENFEKAKIVNENLISEVKFLKNLKDKIETDTRPSENIASLTKNINKDQLYKDIFQKELTADVKNAITTNKNTNQNNNTLAVQNNTIQNAAGNNNNNINNEKNIYKTNPVFPFSVDTNNQNSKLVSYQKEVLNSQYYGNLAKEQERQLDVLNNSLTNITDASTKTSVEKQIKDLTASINKNKTIASQSTINADKLRPEAISEVDTALLTNEQLVLNATQYQLVNTLNLGNEQKQILSLVQNDHEFLKGVQKNYQEVTSEINDLEKKRNTTDVKNQKLIDKELVNKRLKQTELINKIATVSKEANQDEAGIYSELLDKNREINVTNPNLRFANMLEKESEIYFEKASNIRKDADLLGKPEEVKSEYQKANNIEQIAIQKQKYALDLYISSKTTVASNNNTNNNNATISNNVINLNNHQNTTLQTDSNLVQRTTEITLNADEEQQLKAYRQESHKADVLLSEAKSNLADVEAKRNQAAAVFSAAEKKNILKGVDAKEQKSQDMMLNAYKNYGKADSLKYIVYKNQITQFENSPKVISNNKAIARQYTQEADFYFTEASKIRQKAISITDKNQKISELQRATEFEKKALTSQELAVDILTDVNPVFFVSTNDLTKVDRLDVLNQPVDVSEIVRIKTNRIISKINPTEEELKRLDEAEKKRVVSNQLIADVAKYKANIDSLNNVIKNSTNEKDRKKAQKQIPKLEKNMFASQFTSAEVNESINDARYYLYKDYFSKKRLNENTTEARQGKQLEKDANSKYSKAKSLREKAFMKEDAVKAYEIVVQAEKLEAEAIEDQERAYGVYLNLKPLDDEIKEYAEAHKQQVKEENNLMIKTTADITHIETPVDTSSQIIASNETNNNPVMENNTINNNTVDPPLNNNETNNNSNQNTVVENTTNPVDTTSNNNNLKVINNNTAPVDTSSNKNLVVENTIPIDTTSNKVVIENIQPNNNDVNKTISPVDTTTNKNLVVENNNNNSTSTESVNNNQNTTINNTLLVENNTNNLTSVSNPDITSALNREGFGFSVLPVNAYSNEHPIPMNSPLPDGLVFKVQIGAFKAPVKNDAFKGLNPVTGETLTGSAYVRYYVGLFFSEDAANLVKKEIKPFGYNDAFIVAYYNGKKITLFEARRLLKESTTQDNYKLLAQAEVEKIKNRVNNPVNQNITNKVQNNQNQANNVAQNNIATVNSTNVNQTSDLFYTVQIGVYKSPVTAADLKNLEPIYQDNAYGFIRYTTGKFSDPKKAEIEKNRIVQLGITDAFVSAYYKGKKITLGEAAIIELQNKGNKTTEVSVNYPEQQIPVNNTTATINKDNIDFRVQIGAFKEKVPVDKVDEFLTLASTHGLDQEKEDSGLIIYSVGKVKTYAEAVRLRDVLINEGFKDAFIIAYSGKQKISVNDAKNILNQ